MSRGNGAAVTMFLGFCAASCADVLGFERAALELDAGGIVSAVAPLDAAASEPFRDRTEADAGARGLEAGASLVASDAGVPGCEPYCELVQTACTGSDGVSYAVYDSVFSCIRECQQFPEGAVGDVTGNSRACRVAHAQLALQFPGERAFECPAAGPGGDGVCGVNCEGYCSLMSGLCPDSIDGDCLEVCEGVPDLGGFDISHIEGNSLQCRFYHIGAATVSPRFHCPHAAGADPCDDS